MNKPFQPGDVVVCVDGGMFSHLGREYRVPTGSIHVVFESGPSAPTTTAWVTFIGMSSDSILHPGNKCGFRASRFRLYQPPKQEPQTEITEKMVDVMLPRILEDIKNVPRQGH